MPVDSVPLSVKQYVLRLTAGVNWGAEVADPAGRSLLLLRWNAVGAGPGWIPRGSLGWWSCPLHAATVRSSHFFVASIGVS